MGELGRLYALLATPDYAKGKAKVALTIEMAGGQDSTAIAANIKVTMPARKSQARALFGETPQVYECEQDELPFHSDAADVLSMARGED